MLYLQHGNIFIKRLEYLLQDDIIFVCIYRKELLVQSRYRMIDLKRFSDEICQRYKNISLREWICPVFGLNVIRISMLQRIF